MSERIHTEVTTDHPAFKEATQYAHERINKLLSINGKRTVDDFHRELGHILWEYCGMSRNDDGLLKARKLIQELREEFWENALVPGFDRRF